MSRQAFARSDRIRHRSDFQAVFEHGRVCTSGPVRVHARVRPHGQARLGLAVGRRVGNAVRRNRIKRLLRVAFRSLRHDWPSPMDVVVVVLPHQPMSLEQYRRCLDQGVRNAAQTGSTQ